jgi:hypothetical protein
MSSPSTTMSGGARNIVNLTSAWDNALSSSLPACEICRDFLRCWLAHIARV